MSNFMTRAAHDIGLLIIKNRVRQELDNTALLLFHIDEGCHGERPFRVFRRAPTALLSRHATRQDAEFELNGVRTRWAEEAMRRVFDGI